MRLPNGYGGIVNLGKHRRKPFAARITADWTDEGKAIYRYIGYYATRKEALQALADYNTKPYDLDGRKMTFEDIYKKVIEKEFAECSKQKTVSWNAAFNNCKKIHKCKITDLKTVELQDVVDNTTSRSKSTLRNIITVMHAVFKYAMQNDYIAKDYSKFVEVGKTDEKKEKHIFTDDEINALWDHQEDEVCAITLILIYTGFRINELLTLKSENVHLDEMYVQGGLKTKSGKNRIVPIHRRILPLLAIYKKDHLYYITDEDGNQVNYNNFVKKQNRKFAEIGISNHTPHECRHTTASLLNKYNAKDIYIKKILGHSNQDLTKDTYTHIELPELIDTINLIP